MRAMFYDAFEKAPEIRNLPDPEPTFGGVVIKVPPEWSVVVRGVPVLGGLEDKTVPARGASHRLVIDGWVVIGGLEIRN